MQTPVNRFYDRLDRELEKGGFHDTVRALCGAYYSEGGPGRLIEAYPDVQILSALRREFSWTHVTALVDIDDPLQRVFYAGGRNGFWLCA